MMDKMREEFEAWAKTTSLKNFLFWRPSDNQYEVYAVQTAFDGWKASRAALCVELPSEWDDPFTLCDVMDARDVRYAIRDAGVSCK